MSNSRVLSIMPRLLSTKSSARSPCATAGAGSGVAAAAPAGGPDPWQRGAGLRPQPPSCARHGCGLGRLRSDRGPAGRGGGGGGPGPGSAPHPHMQELPPAGNHHTGTWRPWRSSTQLPLLQCPPPPLKPQPPSAASAPAGWQAAGNRAEAGPARRPYRKGGGLGPQLAPVRLGVAQLLGHDDAPDAAHLQRRRQRSSATSPSPLLRRCSASASTQRSSEPHLPLEAQRSWRCPRRAVGRAAAAGGRRGPGAAGRQRAGPAARRPGSTAAAGQCCPTCMPETASSKAGITACCPSTKR
jgi:hypothetical protein